MTEADKQVSISLKEWDLEIFEVIFKKYYSDLCHKAARYVVDSDDAEEVVQDFFIKLWEKKDSIEINTSLPAYLHKAVSNHAINYLKSMKRQPTHVQYSSEIDNLQVPSKLESEIYDDLEKSLNGLLMQMPKKRRVIFQMSRIEEMKNHEIAKELNMSIKTVEYHMSEAIKFLNKKLKDYLPFLVLMMGLIN